MIGVGREVVFLEGSGRPLDAPLKRREAGPEARLEKLQLERLRYQLRLVGQPPLVLVRVQVRVTVPSVAFVMTNGLVVFEVTRSE